MADHDKARDHAKELREWADWCVSCACGNVPTEAGDAYAVLDKLSAYIERCEKLEADSKAWRTAFWVMDGYAVAIHDADGKCYSVRAHDYHRMHDMYRTALASDGRA